MPRRRIMTCIHFIDAHPLECSACISKIDSYRSELTPAQESILKEYVKLGKGIPPIPPADSKRGVEALTQFILSRDLSQKKGKAEVTAVLDFLVMGNFFEGSEIKELRNWVENWTGCAPCLLGTLTETANA